MCRVLTPIDIPSMANIVNDDGMVRQVELVDDAVIANPVAPGTFGSGKFARLHISEPHAVICITHHDLMYEV